MPPALAGVTPATALGMPGRGIPSWAGVCIVGAGIIDSGADMGDVSSVVGCGMFEDGWPFEWFFGVMVTVAPLSGGWALISTKSA